MSDTRNFNGNKRRVVKTSEYSAGERKWYIFYIRPRTERIVYRMLTNLNYEVFCPVIQTVKIWRNRQKKKVKLPLFPNYLFVYTYAYELYAIKCLPYVVRYVACDGKPSTISEKEVEGIRSMLGFGRTITVETRFSKGEHVRIVSGPLQGHEGVLIKQHSKARFGIQLKAINHTVFIDIRQLDLEKL